MTEQRIFVSPHLDDVPLSAFHAVEGSPLIVTVMGGAPDDRPADPWNRKTTGQESAQAALAVRIGEDDAVVNELSARALRLHYWDLPYLDDTEQPRDIAPIVTDLGLILRGADVVYAPLGIRHADHISTSDAVLQSVGKNGLDVRALILYQDTPYGDAYPETMAERLETLQNRGVVLSDRQDVPLAPEALGRKSETLDLYTSQTPWLRQRFSEFSGSIAIEHVWHVADFR